MLAPSVVLAPARSVTVAPGAYCSAARKRVELIRQPLGRLVSARRGTTRTHQGVEDGQLPGRLDQAIPGVRRAVCRLAAGADVVALGPELADAGGQPIAPCQQARLGRRHACWPPAAQEIEDVGRRGHPAAQAQLHRAGKESGMTAIGIVLIVAFLVFAWVAVMAEYRR